MQPSLGPEVLHVVVVAGEVDVGPIPQQREELVDLQVVVLVAPMGVVITTML